MTWKRILWLALTAVSLTSVARAQSWGIGGAVGLINDVNERAALNGFEHSEVNGWVEYRLEKDILLRATAGSMRLREGSRATTTVPGEGGPGDPAVVTRVLKERIHYWTVGASYLLWEGFFTSGLFAGVGGYHIKPDAPPAEFEGGPLDIDETVFGFHAGVDGEFQLLRHFSLVLRLTYHNVSAHPHRQLVNADGGVLFRF